MRTDPSQVLVAQRQRNTRSAMPMVEEYFQALLLRLRSRMVNRSSSDFQVRMGSVEVRRLSEVRNDAVFHESGVFGLLRFEPTGTTGVAALQRSLLTRVIGAMLGDDAGAGEGTDGSRPMSPVESRIAARILRDLALDLRDTWPHAPRPDIRLDGIPGNARVIELDSGDEELFTVNYDFGPADDPFGLFCVTVPTSVLRPMAAGRDAPLPRKSRPVDLGRVLPVEVEVTAEMTRLSMRVKDLQRLEPGDVVPIGSMAQAVLRINGKAAFTGEPGHAHGQRSIRVLSRLKP